MTDLHNEVPVTSNSSAPAQEYKSRLPSVFFGFFAAPFQAHNAKKRGLKGNRYWVAAAISTFAGVLIMAVLAVVVGLAASKAINAQNPSINPGAGNSQPSEATNAQLELPAESITDSPEMVVQNAETIHFRAFRLGNAAYLDHYFLNSSLSGYAPSVASVLPGGEPSEVTESDIVILSNNRAGDIQVEYTIKWNDTPPQRVKTHFVFSSGEWLVESSTLV